VYVISADGGGDEERDEPLRNSLSRLRIKISRYTFLYSSAVARFYLRHFVGLLKTTGARERNSRGNGFNVYLLKAISTVRYTLYL
jgi:hypothetical protein